MVYTAFTLFLSKQVRFYYQHFPYISYRLTRGSSQSSNKRTEHFVLVHFSIVVLPKIKRTAIAVLLFLVAPRRILDNFCSWASPSNCSLFVFIILCFHKLYARHVRFFWWCKIKEPTFVDSLFWQHHGESNSGPTRERRVSQPLDYDAISTFALYHKIKNNAMFFINKISNYLQFYSSSSYIIVLIHKALTDITLNYFMIIK